MPSPDETLSQAESGVAHLQRRSRLLAELQTLVANRNAIDRTAPGGAFAMARVAASIAAKARELRDANEALAGTAAVLDALTKRATLDKALMDMGYEPEPGYIERTYGTGWHRRAAVPVLDSTPPPALDPVMALAAVTDRMADLIEAQARTVTAALTPAQPPQIVLQPELTVTAHMPARQTTTQVQRDPVTGEITQTIQTERDAPDA